MHSRKNRPVFRVVYRHGDSVRESKGCVRKFTAFSISLVKPGTHGMTGENIRWAQVIQINREASHE